MVLADIATRIFFAFFVETKDLQVEIDVGIDVIDVASHDSAVNGVFVSGNGDAVLFVIGGDT